MKPMRVLAVLIGLAAVLVACNMPAPAAPTPFVFPTPNLTLTAVFNPTAINQFPPFTATPSVAPDQTQAAPTQQTNPPTATVAPPTAIPVTNTPWVPTATNTRPPNTQPPTAISYAGPDARPGTPLVAYYFRQAPTIDGSFEEWAVERARADAVVYGADRYRGEEDVSGRLMLGWDEDRLYLAARVVDDVYAQVDSGKTLYRGDGIRLVIDTSVGPDFYLRQMSSDDYQIGISAGTTRPGNNPEAYVWVPASEAGSNTRIKIGAMPTTDGYRIEVAVPWSLLGVNPRAGLHLGFAFSVSDNDRPEEKVQQTMVSTSAIRVYNDPTTWGDLVLSNTQNVPPPPGPTAIPPTSAPPTANPGAKRPGGTIDAAYMAWTVAIDGNLDDWQASKTPLVDVVYGRDKWDNTNDLSGSIKAAWDENYLYLGAQVVDNRYVQSASGAELYLGDSLEMLFDADLLGDFASSSLGSDDYQLGISPGRPALGQNVEAYLWYPANKAGSQAQIKIGAQPTADGYTVEVAIPWSLLGVAPANGARYGFAFSISDNDNADRAVQQSMVSNLDRRVFTDPTTWGELHLIK